MNFASLGWDVVFWTPVGDDEAGDRAVAEVETTGVEVIRFTDPAGTAEHVNLMDRSGERISIFARSGSLDLDIPADQVTELFDIHDYDGIDPYHRQFYEAADWLFMSSVALASWKAFAYERQRAGSDIVVATHGAEGATALVEGRFHSAPAPEVDQIIDTNGAGDAFACGFVEGWLESNDVAVALAAGARQAGRAVAAPGLAP